LNERPVYGTLYESNTEGESMDGDAMEFTKVMVEQC